MTLPSTPNGVSFDHLMAYLVQKELKAVKLTAQFGDIVICFIYKNKLGKTTNIGNEDVFKQHILTLLEEVVANFELPFALLAEKEHLLVSIHIFKGNLGGVRAMEE